MGAFDDKVVLITGGTRGIGRACVTAFAKAGAKVALCGRNAENAAIVAQEIAAKTGAEVRGYGADIADGEAVDTLIKSIAEDLGPIYTLVNNAGITRDGLIMRMKDADWDAVMDTNLRGVFYCCKAVMRGMLKQRAGRIINISSIIGVRGQAGQANYAAAKAGIIGFTKSVAQELASRGITANVVTPGYIDTDMTSGLTDAQRESALEMIPLKRTGQPEDVAGPVLFLAGPDAGYITGAVLPVDGGLGM